MYGATDIYRGIQDPSLVVDKIKDTVTDPIRQRVLHAATTVRYGYLFDEGIDVMSQDWDNLIILDACRYDYFAEMNRIEGDLRRVTSKASTSWPFMQRNYVGRELHDTVFVTANPYYRRLDTEFHTIEPTYDIGSENFDEDVVDLTPEPVYEKAIAAHEMYPNKRLIFHFMQPHEPYLGPTGEEVHSMAEDSPYENSHLAATHGHVSKEKLHAAYRENMEIVLEYIEDLVAEISGKTVITADHGEQLGERIFGRERYGHADEYVTPTSRDVPWLVIDGDTRRETNSDPPTEYESLSDDEFDQQLEALGYK